MQNPLVLAELAQNRLSLRAKSRGIPAEVCGQGANRQEPVGGGKPLGLRQMIRPLPATGSLFEEQRHRILIGGEKLEKRADLKAFSQFLEGVFVAGKGLPIHEDVEARIFTLDDNIKAGRHGPLSLREVPGNLSESLPTVIRRITP